MGYTDAYAGGLWAFIGGYLADISGSFMLPFLVAGIISFLGKVSVALNISICFLKPIYEGDHLIAEAKEEHCGNRTSLYSIKIFHKKTKELVAKSQNQAYIMNENFANT